LDLTFFRHALFLQREILLRLDVAIIDVLDHLLQVCVERFCAQKQAGDMKALLQDEMETYAEQYETDRWNVPVDFDLGLGCR